MAKNVPKGTAPDDPDPIRKKLRRCRNANRKLCAAGQVSGRFGWPREAPTYPGNSTAVSMMFFFHSSPRNVA
jgi:hypothetical protein